jgi:PPOX class probable F420-dependent enzyme
LLVAPAPVLRAMLMAYPLPAARKPAGRRAANCRRRACCRPFDRRRRAVGRSTTTMGEGLLYEEAEMELDRARHFLYSNHRAVMGTRRRDGSPQLSPVVCALDDSGHVVISSRETAIKVKNARRDPSVSLCVFGDAFFGEWIQADGTASIVSLPEAMDGLVAYYRTLRGEHGDWDEYRRSMEQERRVLVVVEITRAGPDHSG